MPCVCADLNDRYTDLVNGAATICSTKEQLDSYTLSYAPQHTSWKDKTAEVLFDSDWTTGVATIPVTGQDQATITFTYGTPVTASSLMWAYMYSGLTYTTYGYMFLEYQDLTSGEWVKVSNYVPAVATTAEENIRSTGNNGRHEFGTFDPATASHWRLKRTSSSSLAISEFRLSCTPTILNNMGKVRCTGRFCSVVAQYALPSMVHSRISSSFTASTVSINGDLVVIDGLVDTNYNGYAGDEGPGNLLAHVVVSPGDEDVIWSVSGSGGGFGGDGSWGCHIDPIHFIDSIFRKFGPAYGLATSPWDFGSGGSSSLNTNATMGFNGGAGGGRIRVFARKELNTYGATFTAIGENGKNPVSGSGVVGRGGGGAGGSIQLHAGTRIAGDAVVTVAGGGTSTTTHSGGGGGGGRIAVYTGTSLDDRFVFTTAGGTASTQDCVGAAGTMYTSIAGTHP